jgi:hypothetical protein
MRRILVIRARHRNRLPTILHLHPPYAELAKNLRSACLTSFRRFPVWYCSELAPK